jgi:hypothetical protein
VIFKAAAFFHAISTYRVRANSSPRGKRFPHVQSRLHGSQVMERV